MVFSCRICGNKEGNLTIQAKEMMYGLKESFDYVECASCGCLQLAQLPEDMGRYYPKDYYSIKSASGPLASAKRALISSRDRYSLLGQGLLGKVLDTVSPNGLFHLIRSKARLTGSSAILDVGCGAGSMLRSLKAMGFADLTGADPYAEPVEESGLRILKKGITEMDGGKRFDLIFFNHSLEHIQDQEGNLSKAARLLKENGTCIVRIPLKSEYIWKRYGTNWVQLDAPRHIFLHTTRSFALLAERSGFELTETIFDSSEFVFIGSDAYEKGIPLERIAGNMLSPKGKLLHWGGINRLRAKAAELNAKSQGDQAAFILKLPKEGGRD
ncbi:MAG: class I SAM-dependent methyltransferase [Candidatus Micrarchaeota archaeon]